MKKDILRKTIFHILLITVFSLIAYSNTFHAPFHYDDEAVIVNNPIIKDLQLFIEPSKAEAFKGYFEYKTFKHRYIGYLTFALNYRRHGLDAAGYHILNLLIHIITALLIYLLVTLSFKTPYLKESSLNDYSKLIAVFTALLFACHPIQTMAITYIWQRVASLATMFYVLSLVSYIKYRLLNRHLNSNCQSLLDIKLLSLYLISIIASILAMKTKEMAFTLPVIITLYEFMFFEGNIKKRILYLIPLSLTMLIIPLSIVGIDRPIGEVIAGIGESTRVLSPLPRSDYLFTEFRVILTYIRLLFFPVNQNLNYDYPIYHSFFNTDVSGSFLLLLSLFIFSAYLFYRYRHTASYTRLISFGIFWFFIALSVESSFIPVLRVIEEHRIYLPSIGFFITLSTSVFVVVEKLKNKSRGIDRVVTGVFAIVIVVLTGATYARNIVWKDNVSLWEDVVTKSPGGAPGHNNLGNAYESKGLIDKAIQHYQIAIQINPYYAKAYYNRGGIYALRDNHIAALKDFDKAIEINSNYLEAYYNRGKAFENLGNHLKAVEDYNKAIEINPELDKAYYNLGVIYDSIFSNYGQAIANYSRTIELNPAYSKAYNNRGILYAMKGRYLKAMDDFNTVISINPEDAVAYYNRGHVYKRLGKYREAENDFKTAERLGYKN